MIRRVPFTLLLVALVAVVSAAAAPDVLAQDSGVDQYLENPGAAPEEGGGGGSGGGGSGGGGSGGGGTGGGSQPASSAPSGGWGASGGGSGEPPGTASDATPGSATGGKLGDADASSGKGENDNGDNGLVGSPNSGLEEVESSTASDSGSSGIGVVLPIVLGALVLGAIVFVVVRRRRRLQTGGA